MLTAFFHRFHLRTLALGSVGALAVACAAVVAAPGCTVLTNDALPDDAGAFEGSAADATPAACGTCVAQECIGPWTVCLGDERCQKLRQCATPFGESKGARDQCFCAGSVAPDGGLSVDPLAAYIAFASCNDSRTCATKCATDCKSTCASGAPQTTPACAGSDAGTDGATPEDGGDAAVAPAVASVEACAECVSGKCDAAKKLCAIGSECSAFLACANGCIDASCVDACGKSHSTGKASAKELSNCTLTSCRSACGL